MRKTTSTAMRWGVLGLFVLAGAAGTEARAALLRWKLKSGETLHYVMEQKTVTGVKAGQQDVKTTVTQLIDMDWSVKSVSSDGAAEMTQTITRVRTKMESPFGGFEYDSKDPKEPQGPAAASLVPLLKALIGAEFAFKMSPQGELSNVKVPEKVVQALGDAGAVGGAGAGMFSEERLKNMISESSLALPKENLAKGTSWKRQTKIPSPPIGTMTLDKTFSYQGPESQAGKSVERIDLGTKIEIQPDPAGKLDFKIQSQEGKGTFFFDNTAGRVTESTVTEKIEMTVKIMDMDFAQTSDTMTTMKLTPASSPGDSK
jgi:hypothetical protein